MKIGVMMCALRERKMIIPAIRQFDRIKENYDLEVVVACSKKSWYGNVEGDDTAELAVRAGATVRLHDWVDEKDQKNWILDKMKDKNWVLLFAPDMFMEYKSQLNTMLHLQSADKRGYGCKMVTYWKDLDTAVNPATTFNSFAIKPDERFAWSSKIERFDHFEAIPEVTMHHLSWVRSDEDMLNKLNTWSHAPEVREKWFEQVWKGYDDKTTYVTAFNNQSDRMYLKPYSLPQELKDIISKYKL